MDVEAFEQLTRLYQNLVFASALSMVRDPHVAKDVAQESFLAAYHGLGRLERPEAFPGWLRGIVRHQAGRVLRERHWTSVPLDEVPEPSHPASAPDLELERREAVSLALAAIDRLPQTEREVTALYYLQEYSQQEIAEFLELPVTTVNNRLHAARRRLQERTLQMLSDGLGQQKLPEDFASTIGQIVRIRGPVVDARFDEDELPAVLSNLAVTDWSGQVEVVVEVTQHLGGGLVRCVAGGPTRGLTRGMRVVTGQEAGSRPATGATLEQAIELLAASADARLAQPDAEAPRVLETGIKAIDLFCPFAPGGKVGFFGHAGVGKLVLIEELVRNLARDREGVLLFGFVQQADAGTLRDTNAMEDMPAAAATQTFHLLTYDPADPELGGAREALDTVVSLSPELGARRLYPAVDPLLSGSRVLDAALVGAEHEELARRARELFRREAELGGRAEAEPLTAGRAERLRLFLTQPFAVAESFTKIPGVRVSRAETLRGCRAILDGECDAWPEAAFRYAGTLDEVRAKAGLA